MKLLIATMLFCLAGSYILAAASYVIVPYPPTQTQLDAAVQTMASVRISDDGALCILKWTGATPEVFAAEASQNNNEMLSALNGNANWDGE